MKLKTTKLSLVLSTMLIIFLCSLFTYAQTNQITEKDKTEIISEILKQQNFEFERPTISSYNIKHKNTIYLLEDNISSNSLPQIRNINFELVTHNQINLFRKDGFQYYAFNDFRVDGDSIKVNYGRYFEDAIYDTNSRRTPWDSVVKLVEYSFYEKSNGWKIKRKVLKYEPFDIEDPTRYTNRPNSIY